MPAPFPSLTGHTPKDFSVAGFCRRCRNFSLWSRIVEKAFPNLAQRVSVTQRQRDSFKGSSSRDSPLGGAQSDLGDPKKQNQSGVTVSSPDAAVEQPPMVSSLGTSGRIEGVGRGIPADASSIAYSPLHPDRISGLGDFPKASSAFVVPPSPRKSEGQPQQQVEAPASASGSSTELSSTSGDCVGVNAARRGAVAALKYNGASAKSVGKLSEVEDSSLSARGGERFSAIWSQLSKLPGINRDETFSSLQDSTEAEAKDERKGSHRRAAPRSAWGIWPTCVTLSAKLLNSGGDRRAEQGLRPLFSRKDSNKSMTSLFRRIVFQRTRSHDDGQAQCAGQERPKKHVPRCSFLPSTSPSRTARRGAQCELRVDPLRRGCMMWPPVIETIPVFRFSSIFSPSHAAKDQKTHWRLITSTFGAREGATTARTYLVASRSILPRAASR